MRRWLILILCLTVLGGCEALSHPGAMSRLKMISSFGKPQPSAADPQQAQRLEAAFDAVRHD